MSTNKRMFGTGKHLTQQNKNIAKLMFGGVCTIPVFLMVKYEVDMNTYEERMVVYRERRKQQAIDAQHGTVILFHTPQKPEHPFFNRRYQ